MSTTPHCNFDSIEDILNFRFNHRKYTTGDWESYSDRWPILNRQPRVFSHFRYVYHTSVYNERRVTITHNPESLTNSVFCSAGTHVFARFECAALRDLPNAMFKHLVVMGDDTPMDEGKLSIFRDRFANIHIETKHSQEPGYIRSLPMGGIMVYMLRNGGSAILEHINNHTLPHSRTKLVASSFGSKWPHLTDQIKQRSLLSDFISAAGIVDHMCCAPEEYYGRLSEYKYFVCPIGEGIQTPKIQECLLLGVIPIVMNHPVYPDLLAYDLPMLVVDDWSEITPEFLEREYENKFRHVDWHHVRKRFHVDHFSDIYLA